jgi:hypothetical protein
VTDDAGTVVFSFVEGDEYELQMYDSNSQFLFSKTLKINFTEYYISIDTYSIEWDTNVSISYIVLPDLPSDGYIRYDSSGFDFNVTVEAHGSDIFLSYFGVINEDGNLHFNTNCGTGCGYTVREEDLNSSKSLYVWQFVMLEDGRMLHKQGQYIPIKVGEDNFVLTLSSAEFKNLFGCSSNQNEPCFFLLMVSALLTVGVMVTAGVEFGARSTGSLGAIALIMIGLFTYLTWVPNSMFILIAIAVFASMIVSRRTY